MTNKELHTAIFEVAKELMKLASDNDLAILKIMEKLDTISEQIIEREPS